jgi:hypothetical protein
VFSPLFNGQPHSYLRDSPAPSERQYSRASYILEAPNRRADLACPKATIRICMEEGGCRVILQTGHQLQGPEQERAIPNNKTRTRNPTHKTQYRTSGAGNSPLFQNPTSVISRPILRPLDIRKTDIQHTRQNGRCATSSTPYTHATTGYHSRKQTMARYCGSVTRLRSCDLAIHARRHSENTRL